MIATDARTARGRCGFSVVELLVVIGIIAVLIALLLPVLVKARKQAYQVACMSNLRQVAIAVLFYAEANKGRFPASGFAETMFLEDWVHWQPGRDVREGGVLPYLGKSVEVLKCPLGVPERGPIVRTGGGGTRTFPAYPYSYSINIRFTGYSAGPDFNPRWGGEGFAILGKIVNSSEKAMLIEEDVTGINDGAWFSEGTDWLNTRRTSVSLRHDKDREFEGDAPGGSYFRLPRGGRGNVAFADGHCEFYPRWNLQYPRHTKPDHREP